ncbi:hypothetical protein NE235_02995 [Actinoallomurus spadix]|uniref:WXG100-like domain-containing protein n=1 Tax=Actinoallomurus spadix TaxID=79912 RepID=UPI002092A557|nr:hypothetical protein [Actinoallomurus spadix]MCO5985071.1 hypothetical protein [Actinoallomurus spadix]
MAAAATRLATGVDDLCEELSAAGACWGSDDIGRAFFNGDESTAGFGAARDVVLAQLADMVNLLRATGGLLAVSGHTYRLAEEAATVGSAIPAGADQNALAQSDPYRLPPVTSTLVRSDPPPAAYIQILNFLETLVGGCPWPDGDTASLTAMRDAFTAMAGVIDAVAEEVDGHAQHVTTNNAGENTDKFASFAAALQGGGEEGGLRWLSSACRGLAGAVDHLIRQKNAAREQFILTLIFLAATWAIAWAASGITFGGSVATATVTTEVEGFALKAFLQTIAKSVLAGMWYGAGMDAAGQVARIDQGLQKGFNTGELLKAAGQGGLAGGVMGAAGGLVAVRSTKLTTALSNWMGSSGFKGAASRFAFAGTTGTAGNVAAQLAFDHHVNLGEAAAFGFGMAGMSAAGEAGKHFIGHGAGAPSGSGPRIEEVATGADTPRSHDDPPPPGPHDDPPPPDDSLRRGDGSVPSASDLPERPGNRDDTGGGTDGGGGGRHPAGGGTRDVTAMASAHPERASSDHGTAPHDATDGPAQNRINDIINGGGRRQDAPTVLPPAEMPGERPPGVGDGRTGGAGTEPGPRSAGNGPGPAEPPPTASGTRPEATRPTAPGTRPEAPQPTPPGTRPDNARPPATGSVHQESAPPGAAPDRTATPPGGGNTGRDQAPVSPSAGDGGNGPASGRPTAESPRDGGTGGSHPSGVLASPPVDHGPGRTEPHTDGLPPADVPGDRVPRSTADHSPLTPESLERSQRSGVIEERRLPGGNVAESVSLVTFGDGRVIVEKAVRTPEEAHAEYLTSRLGQAIGAPVPRAVLDGHTVRMEYAEGSTAREVHRDYENRPDLPYWNSPEGRRLGLLDVLAGNGDRSGNNWMIGPGGEIAGVDHAQAFDRLGVNPLENPFVKDLVEPHGLGSYRIIDNPLSHSDVAHIRRSVEGLRPEFERLGRQDWYDDVMRRVRELDEHAQGTRPLYGGAPHAPAHQGAERPQHPPQPDPAPQHHGGSPAPHHAGEPQPAPLGGDRTRPLAESVTTGVRHEEPLIPGRPGYVDRVTFNDGTTAIRKQFRYPREADAEALASRVGEALGVRVPRVHQDGPTVYMDEVGGRNSYQVVGNEGLTEWANSPEGRRLGLFDVLIQNPDRTGSNWHVDANDHIYAIDHSDSFAGVLPSPRLNRFSAHYLNEDRPVRPEFAEENPLSARDIEDVRQRLQTVQPEFERRGRDDWYDAMMGRLDELGRHATGTEPYLEAGSEPRAPLPRRATEPPSAETRPAPATPSASSEVPRESGQPSRIERLLRGEDVPPVETPPRSGPYGAGHDEHVAGGPEPAGHERPAGQGERRSADDEPPAAGAEDGPRPPDGSEHRRSTPPEHPDDRTGTGEEPIDEFGDDWDDLDADIDFLSDLPPHEKDAVERLLADDGIHRLNEALASDDPQVRAEARAWADDAGNGLRALPPASRETVYHYTSLPADRLAELVPGADVTMHGVLDTTMVHTPAHGHPVELIIHSRNGADVSILTGRDQVVFRPETRFRVLAEEHIELPMYTEHEDVRPIHRVFLAELPADGTPLPGTVPDAASVPRPLDERLQGVHDEAREPTRAGVAYFDPRDPSTPAMLDSARSARPIDGVFSFDLHANPSNARVGGERLTGGDVAALLSHEPELTRPSGHPEGDGPPRILRSLGCDSGRGRNPIAQEIANETGRIVIAPDNQVWIDANGDAQVSAPKVGPDGRPRPMRFPPEGAWRIFVPEGAHSLPPAHDAPLSGQDAAAHEHGPTKDSPREPGAARPHDPAPTTHDPHDPPPEPHDLRRSAPDDGPPADHGAHTGHSESYAQRRQTLADDVASGIDPEHTVLLGRADTSPSHRTVAERVELVTFENGAEAVRKEMKVGKEDQTDREELGALVGHAVEAPVPVVHRDSDLVVYMEYIEGDTLVALYPEAWEPAELDHLGYQDTPAARRLGLLDVLIENNDRHNGNLIIGDDGELHGIDHNNAFGERIVDPEANSFTGDYVSHLRRVGSEWEYVWKPNSLTHEDVELLRSRLEALRPEFERRGRQDWYERMMGYFEHIEDNASGTSSLLASAHDTDPVVHPSPEVPEAPVDGADRPTPAAETARFAEWGDRAEAIRRALPPDGLPHDGNLRDIILSTPNESAVHPDVQQWIKTALDFDHPATGLRFTISEEIGVLDGEAVISGEFVDSDGANQGMVILEFHADEGGEPYLNIGLVELEVQGRGIAVDLLERVENWAIGQGVHDLRLWANIDVGGYAWAMHGFDFDARFPYEESGLPELVELVNDRINSGEMSPEGVRQWEAMADRAGPEAWGTPGRVTAYELSRLGWEARRPDSDGRMTWDGKQILRAGAWQGVRFIEPPGE